MQNINTLNIFHWATSELSQDAFLAWLVSWADPQYKSINHDLYHCALQFIHSLIKKDHHLNIQTIEVKRQ
ncbi:hypothetical protein [Commensalibacter nepenthis]|uniref:Uncharacterized protein n=1 Tax=Commensalibacter nepenthis TaxID=3043872 RepID=A0ABT6Q8M6_9PROT|nr:hypothetical protein [Commensalibacter sp. TBRC 10068]MDI2113255.1 hypothetical protein [Commensalibacter sp. TBRC 10068]